MMEVSGTSHPAEMLLQPPPDLCFHTTRLRALEAVCLTSTWRSLRGADYVTDGMKEEDSPTVWETKGMGTFS